MEVVITLIVAALLGLIPAKIAKSKGRSFGKWWIYGFLLFIVAIIHACVLKPCNGEKTNSESSSNSATQTETASVTIQNGSPEHTVAGKASPIKGVMVLILCVGLIIVGILMITAVF